MKRFLVLYYSSVPAQEQIANASPEMAKAGMALWTAWMKKVGKALVDVGAPLASVGSANAEVTGYSILEAESAQTAEALVKDHPHYLAPGASIEIHEFQDMPGM